MFPEEGGVINIHIPININIHIQIFHTENKNMTKICWRGLGFIGYHPGYMGGPCIILYILFYLRLFLQLEM